MEEFILVLNCLEKVVISVNEVRETGGMIEEMLNGCYPNINCPPPYVNDYYTFLSLHMVDNIASFFVIHISYSKAQLYQTQVSVKGIKVSNLILIPILILDVLLNHRNVYSIK